MKRQHSVPFPLVHSLLSAAKAKNVDVESVAKDAGLSHWLAFFDEQSDQVRVPLDEFSLFLITLWRLMDDESGGFAARQLKIGTFAMMCHSIISAGNLRRSLIRSARYIKLITDDLEIELEERGSEARLIFDWHNPNDLDSVFFITSLFVIWVRLSCWLIDQPMLMERVQFNFPKPDFGDEFELMFPCRIEFSQSRNMFAFDSKQLAQPLRQTPDTLASFLTDAPQSLLTQFRDDNSVTAQIKRLLMHQGGEESPLSPLSFDDIAEALKTTTHTLRRRLKDEGHSFQEIKDSIRRDVAVSSLKHSDVSVQDLAEQLGFSESAAFIRAFKKWTGHTPSGFREQSS